MVTMSKTLSSPPLEGIRVVELGSSLAGPFAALILGQLGAEVFKVESTEGDAMRRWGTPVGEDSSGPFEAFNRGKRSLVVDFKNEVQVKSLRRFIEDGADVVLQNLRPRAAARFGLGAEEMTKRCPRLVYCNQWAYGDRGPLTDLPGYDPLLQAFSGIIHATGEAGRDPARVGVSLIDLSTGMWGAMGILALLTRRATTGAGGVTDASLLETSLAFMGLHHASLTTDDQIPERSGLTGPLISPNGGFTASDGIVMIVVGTDGQFARLCKAIGLDALGDDTRFITTGDRYANRSALTELLNQHLVGESRAHWAEKLNASNIPNAPVQDLREASNHPQTEAIGMVQKSPDGTFSVMGIPLRFDGERPAYVAPAPHLGEHTALLSTSVAANDD